MQLRKNPPFEINSDDPFANDTLEHRPSIELLSKLIQSTDQPFTLTVEAPWGWGKTKFIERWKAHLAKEKHVCLYFNAWENDFVSDPLVAFIGELGPIVKAAKGGTNENSIVRKNFSRLQKLGVSLLKKGAPLVVKAVATKALSSEVVKEISETVSETAENVAESLSEAVKKQIEHYDEEKNSIKHFRETLKQLAESVTSGDDTKKQVVFFVDELDRCRPDFAMTLLERIKHLFNVDKIVFVLALDREQLRNTVRYLYGSGGHADTYLRRFIDFSFQLPKPLTRAFAELLQTRFNMLDFFQGRSNAQVQYNRFLPAFINTSNWLDLDLRTQEQCFTRLNAIFRMWPAEKYLPTDAFCVLVGLRVGKPELFESFRSNKTPLGDHIPKSLPNDEKSIEFRLLVETTFIAAFSPLETLQHEITQLESYLPTQDYQANHFAKRRLQLFEYVRHHRDDLNRLIEFTNRLS